MKRLIGMFIAVFVMLAAVITVNAENMQISVGNASAGAGDTVNVAVSIKNNTGAAIGSVKIKFDKEKLVPVSVTKKDILLGSMYFTSNLEDENLDASELGEVTFSWMNVTDLTGDGDIASIEFIVKENVTENIPLELEITELANSLQEDIAAAVVGGSISIGNGGGQNVGGSDYSVEISSTTIQKGESEIGGVMKLSVYSSKAEKLTFICAVYDNNGRLIAARTADKGLTEGINEVEFAPVSAPVTGIGKYAVKVYSWNSLTGMRPVAESILKTY